MKGSYGIKKLYGGAGRGYEGGGRIYQNIDNKLLKILSCRCWKLHFNPYMQKEIDVGSRISIHVNR